MATKLQAPVKMPRFTTEEFREMKREYVAKHGYTTYIPGYRDIFVWDITVEPSETELALYKKNDIETLGDKRYYEIKDIMLKKKEKFLRMLGSPTPDIVHNAASIMTTLDDINDTLGTFAMLLRMAAYLLPQVAQKYLLGPAGWALVGADIANVAMDLSRLPFKAARIQHALHDTVKGHPLSKKAKLCRLNKLKRLSLSKGEIIEGLQTTENMFGVGLVLGPLVGLVYDIPAGLYHHVRGEKVTIKGLPGPLLWFDRIWANMLRGAAALWTGIPIELDQELTKSMVAVNLAAQAADSIRPEGGPIDAIDNMDGIMIPARKPEHPSTKSIVEDELGDPNANTGWPFSSHDYIEVKYIIDYEHELVQANLNDWRERNTQDLEAMVGAQNAVEAGLLIVGNLNDYECILLEYDCHTQAMLKLMNQGYRYPLHATTEQVQHFYRLMDDYCQAYGEVSYQDALLIADQVAGFEFTTKVPDRTGPTLEDLESDNEEFKARRRKEYTSTIFFYTDFAEPRVGSWPDYMVYRYLMEINIRLRWLQTYGWEEDQPSIRGSTTLERVLTKMMKRLDLPITKTTLVFPYFVPVYDPNNLFGNTYPA